MSEGVVSKDSEGRNALRPRGRRQVSGLTLAWRKFRQGKLPMAGGVVLLAMYIVFLNPTFFAPYLQTKSSMRIFMPPMRVRFFDKDGTFHLRPFVHGIKVKVNLEFETIFEEDRDVMFPIRFFVKRPKGEFGLRAQQFRTVLFGVDEPGYIHLFGTDYRGRDLFSRVLFGGQISLTIGMFSVVLSTVIGTIMGTISGYFGGVVDMVIQRLIEIIASIPTLPLWLSLAAVLPKDWPPTLVYWGMVTILAFIGWTGLARAMRAMVLGVRERDFVLASQAGGGGDGHIMLRHIIPNCLSHLIVVATMSLPGAIMAESALSFLGLGIKPPMASWGLLIRGAQELNAILIAPWIMIPGLFIMITVMAFNFLGDGLRDAADPYS